MVIQPNPPRASKEMIFEWCKGGKHDKCRTQYGGDRIICICDCENHGVNYEPIHKAMTEEEVKASIASLQSIMTVDADGRNVGNRAIQDNSPIWGEQVREGNKTVTTYANTGSSTVYAYREVKDAATIEELKTRRAKTLTKFG
jgi:hypothetical protein